MTHARCCVCAGDAIIHWLAIHADRQTDRRRVVLLGAAVDSRYLLLLLLLLRHSTSFRRRLLVRPSQIDNRDRPTAHQTTSASGRFVASRLQFHVIHHRRPTTTTEEASLLWRTLCMRSLQDPSIVSNIAAALHHTCHAMVSRIDLHFVRVLQECTYWHDSTLNRYLDGKHIRRAGGLSIVGLFYYSCLLLSKKK